MSFNTRSTSNITYSKTRSSLSARRFAEKTDALLKSPKKLTTLGGKKSQRRTEKKSYSLRNAKSNTKPKLDETIQHTPEQTTSKRKETATKKISTENLLIVLSDNSNDSSEVDFKQQTEEVEVGGGAVNEDVVIVLSDDEDHDKRSSQLNTAQKVCNADVTIDNDNLKEVEKNGSETSSKNTSEVAEIEAESPKTDLIENNDKILESLEDSACTLKECPSVQTDVDAKDNISELSKLENFVPAVSPQAVSLRKTSNQDHLEHPDEETDDQNQEKIKSNATADTASGISENEIQSDLMSDKVEPESFEFCKQINDNASLTSPNVSERPVSSNSRSTTSTSSIILRDNDIYSPGSTDLSMSEDSRGSFIESGSEKTVQRRSRGRMKRTSVAKPSGQTKSYAEHVSSSCSPSEDGSMEPPSKRNKRLPSRVGITWEIGHRLEAVDHNECRYPAKIVEVDKDACEVLIHFEGWSARFDEWVPMDSPKLRPTSSPNLKNETKEKKAANQQYKANEKILARWNDGKLYDATVTEAHSEGYYVVVFYDGFTKKLPVSAMRKLNDPTVKKRRLQLLNSPQKANLGSMPGQAREVKGKNAGSTPVSSRRSSSSLDTSPVKTNVSPGSVASKQFVVECDHNQFKCTFEGCSKEFRKETLLQSHLKHYHNCEKGSSDVSGRSSPVRPKKVRSRIKSASLSSEPERPKDSPLIVEEDVPCHPIKCESEPSKTQVNDEKMLLQITQTVMANILTENKEEITPTPPTLQAPPPLLTTTTLPAQLPFPATTELETSAVIEESEMSAKSAEVKVKPVSVAKVMKPSRRKEIYPVTKMETRHAKPCLFRDDSIYTGYISYRSLYTKGSRGRRKSVDTEPKRGRHGKNEDDKTFPETKKRRRRLSHKTELNKRKSDYPDIDEEIAEIKRRRVDRVSESSVKTDENTWDSVDYDENEEDDETVSDQQEVNSDELVRCICENEEENGLMFQCEECKTWQHAACFNIENEEDVPDKYFCYMCSKPKSQPVESPVTEEDPWFTTGVLSTFSFLKEKPPVSRPNAVLATHELINSTTKILSVLKGLQHKIQIAGSDNHADLRHWSKPWKQHGVVKPPSRKPELVIAPPSIASQSATDAGDFLVFDHAYFSQSDSAIGLQEEVVTEEPEMSTNSIDISLSVNPNVFIPDVKQRRPVQVGQEPRERNTRRRGGGREGGRGRGRWRDAHHLNVPPVEEVIDVGTCKNNIIGHIHSVQDNMDQELNLIESQLSLLEAEMDNSGWTGHCDSGPVLKSLKSLSKDLDVVQRFTLL